MPHAYVSVTFLKGTGVLSFTGTAYDTRIRQIAENVSEQIDRYCNRTFQPYLGTFRFAGDGSTLLLIKDLAAIGSLREDDGNDGTFDTVWAAADYLLEPYNAQPTTDWGRPYTSIRVSPKSDGSQDAFLAGPDRYEITGTWGFTVLLSTALPVASGSLATGTAITVNTAGIEPGQMILIGSEIIYVQSTSGTSLTVQRGAMSSTVGTHASGSVIKTYSYPGPVQEAAMIQTARLWQRRNSGFANQVGFLETGVIQTWRGGLDPDVRDMLAPYRRLH